MPVWLEHRLDPSEAERKKLVVMMKLPKLKQIFFDCDNTLVQTETLAFCQTGSLVNELMEIKGVEERYVGEKLITDYVGLTFKQVLPQLGGKPKFDEHVGGCAVLAGAQACQAEHRLS